MKKSVFALTLAAANLLLTTALLAQPAANPTRNLSLTDPAPVQRAVAAEKKHRIVVSPDQARDISRISPKLKWNETFHAFTVAMANDTDAELRVLAAQTTGGLYLVSLPTVIPAKDQADFSLLYLARPGESGDEGLIRVLTNRGERVITVKNDRAQSAQFDVSALHWQQGALPETKVVTLTVAPGTAVPLGARAMGDGNKATLEATGNGTYQVKVSPASTDQPHLFPVIVIFDQETPGVNSVITCVVDAKAQ